MNIRKLLVLFASFSLLTFGQVGGGRGKSRNVPRYDPSTEATFKGTVEEVKEVAHPGFQGKCLHAILKTDQGTVDVRIGPASFLSWVRISVPDWPSDQLTAIHLSGSPALD